MALWAALFMEMGGLNWLHASIEIILTNLRTRQQDGGVITALHIFVVSGDNMSSQFE